MLYRCHVLRTCIVNNNIILKSFYYENSARHIIIESLNIFIELCRYDSQQWEKPFSVIRNERLIVNQKIKPFLKKRATLAVGAVLSVTIFFAFFVSLSLVDVNTSDETRRILNLYEMQFEG